MQKAGCVLFSKDFKKVALVYRDKNKDFDFPKGHIEKGESLVECAIRETEEETGRKCKIIFDEHFSSFYTNYEGDIEVVFYIATDMGEVDRYIDPRDKEHLIWTNVEDVEKTLTYDDLKKLWETVYQFLKYKGVLWLKYNWNNTVFNLFA